MGAVDDAVQNRIADRRVAHQLVPALDGDLAGDQQRSLLVAVVDDLEQVTPVARR